MKRLVLLFSRMGLGFFLCALGTVLALNSNLGLSPWDVFHQGLSNFTGITIGQASIITGVVIVGLTALAGLEIGLGTALNMVIVGLIVDLIIYLKIVPVVHTLLPGILMMLASIMVTAIGSSLYISCGMGCGPRDGLMVFLVKRTSKPLFVIRLCMESSAMIIGFFMGGKVGVGTLITAFGLGFCVQFFSRAIHLDMKKLVQKNFKQCLVFLKESVTQ